MSEMIIIGDRVLIEPKSGEQLTDSGIVLPATVAEKEKVQTGRVVQIGPGYVLPNPEFNEGEPWAQAGGAARYLPLQAQKNDYAFFLRKDAIEITYKEKTYLIVNHHNILALVRPTFEEALENVNDIDEIIDSK